MPTNVIKKKNKRIQTNKLNKFNSHKNNHAIQKRVLPVYFDDLNLNTSIKFNPREKRAVNGQPIVLNIELLVVTDSDVYKNFQALADTTNKLIVFQLMQHYYAHLINGVNQRYQVSLTNDPDLRINVILTNFLFLTEASEDQWLRSSVDPIFQTYNGKQTAVIDKAYQNFLNFMTRLNLNFQFDHAAGFFYKDLFSNDYTLSIQKRANIAGYCPGYICTPRKFSINEDFGGFANLLTVAHELGHNLGAEHDGFGVAAFCSQNFIMAPSNTEYSTNQFSSCSINQFKTLLLNSDYSGVSQNGECLLNIPSNKPIETELTQNKSAGEFLSPDDQCKMIYGPTASFCPTNSDSMCQLLYCRQNSTVTTCTASTAAADGTLCATGKVCQLGSCMPKASARTGTCLNGDDLIIQSYTDIQLKTPQTNCTDFFKLVTNVGQSISGHCNIPVIGDVCCQSCKKYKALICKDLNGNCTNNANSCSSQLIINGAIKNIRDICPKTCSVCKASPLTCEQAPSICQNGGTCSNINVVQTVEFGFKCSCPTGYSGELCETKNSNSCTLNPCKNGGTCQAFGSLGYICKCPIGCSGYDCNQCLNSTSTTITVSTTATVIDACINSPCLNGATCRPIGVSFLCTCTNGCSGNTCNICSFVDFNTTLCKELRAQGACNLNSYIEFKLIKDACAASCSDVSISTTKSTPQHTFTPIAQTSSFSITDYDVAVCQFYKKHGLCEKNAFISGQPIRIACGASCNSGSTTPSPSLIDLYPSNCQFYREKGLCELNTIIGSLPIKQACAFSCNGSIIPVTTSAPCFDEYPSLCSAWKNNCNQLAGGDKNPCKKTCSICS